MVYIVGQKVRLIDDGKIYDTYYGWATDNKFTFMDPKVRELWAKYLIAEDNNCKKDTELTIVATGCHGNDRCINMYLCEDPKGNPVLVCEKGLALIKEEEKLKWADLKIGDIIKKRMYGFNSMITGIDSSEFTSTHVFVNGSWITDEELNDCWEKV